MGVAIILSEKECVLSMERSSNDAAVTGALIKSSKEECASSTEQRRNANYAAARGV